MDGRWPPACIPKYVGMREIKVRLRSNATGRGPKAEPQRFLDTSLGLVTGLLTSEEAEDSGSRRGCVRLRLFPLPVLKVLP